MTHTVARFPAYVFLSAAYPVLALLAANVGQLTPADALRSFLVLQGMAVLLLLLWRLAMGTWAKAGAMALLSLLLIFSYGQFYVMVEDAAVAGVLVGRHRFLVGLWMALLVAGFVLLRRSRTDMHRWTPTLNLLALILVLLPTVRLVLWGWQEAGRGERIRAEQPTSPGAIGNARPTGAMPDIYYIILDSYTREEVLSGIVGLDSRAFLSRLESLGFFVAGCSRSNYSNTVTSLASSLNGEYLDVLDPGLFAADASPDAFAAHIQDNRVVADLRRLGYDLVAFESGISATEFTQADLYLAPSRDPRALLVGGLNSFESLLLKTSLGLFLYEIEPQSLPYLIRTNLYDRPYVEHRDRIQFILDRLPEIAERPGPKFVFVHILAPHRPFVFSADGSFVERERPFDLNDDLEVQDWDVYAARYAGQVEYLNRRVLEILPAILSASPTPPIIVIQGDHGIPRLDDPRQRVAILNAYRLPGDGADRLYPSISPVNSFRAIAQEYFGSEVPLLADRSFLGKRGRLSFDELAEANPECVP